MKTLLYTLLFFVPIYFYFKLQTNLLFYSLQVSCSLILFVDLAIFFMSLSLAWLGQKMTRSCSRRIRLVITPVMIILFTGVLTMLLFSLSDDRRVSPEGTARWSMSHIRSFTESYYVENNNSYESFCELEDVKFLGKHAESWLPLNINSYRNECFGSYTTVRKFSDQEIEEKNKLIKFTCNDSKDAYAAEIYVPSREKYMCVDLERGLVGFSETSIGTTTTCELE